MGRWTMGSEEFKAKPRRDTTATNARDKERGESSRKKAMSRRESDLCASRRAIAIDAPAVNFALRPHLYLPLVMACVKMVSARGDRPGFFNFVKTELIKMLMAI